MSRGLIMLTTCLLMMAALFSLPGPVSPAQVTPELARAVLAELNLARTDHLPPPVRHD